MTKAVKAKGAGVKCPKCHEPGDTRIVKTESGYDPSLVHYVCDYCQIGWYMHRGSRTGSIFGNYSTQQMETFLETAKNFYVKYLDTGKPIKLPSGRVRSA